MSFEIFFYQAPGGKKPPLDFIKGLSNAKLRQKVYCQLSLLEEFGPELREPDSKCLESGIFELRVIFSNEKVRLFYFFKLQKIVVTNGFLKKTRKTPFREIEKAKKYKREYLQRAATLDSFLD